MPLWKGTDRLKVPKARSRGEQTLKAESAWSKGLVYSSRVGLPCTGVCRAGERDRSRVEKRSQGRGRKVECFERGPLALERGKGRQALPLVIKRKKTFPRLERSLGNERGTDRNRRVSSPLSPISSLLLSPSGKLSQKLPILLAEDEKTQPPLVLETQRRPRPKDLPSGIPSSEWPTVLPRVLEQKPSLRHVADE